MRVLIGASMREAIAERAAIIDDIVEGRFAPAAQQSRETLGDFAKRWLVRKQKEGLRKHTIERYLEALERHILPDLGDIYVEALTSKDIFAWRDQATSKLMANGKGYSSWSVASWFSVLRNIVQDVVLEYELPRNPCDGVRGIRKPKAPRATRYINAQQLREFLRLVQLHCPQHFAVTLVLALFGLRWEEVSALHQEHLDREAMELRIVQAQVGRKVYPTKNENHKVLPLTREVLEAIDEHRKMLEIRHNPGVERGLLFPGSNGNYRLPSSVSKGWKTVSEALGLSWILTPHDLRRSFQNLLRQASVNQIVQQALMGHSSDAMTEHYSCVDMQEKRQAQEKVVDLLKFKNIRQSGS